MKPSRVAWLGIAVIFLLSACGQATPAPSPSKTANGVSPTAATAAPTPTLPVTPSPGDPYLGQKAPGAYPLRFASRFIKGDLHTPPVFTPDGREAYWAVQGDGANIYTMRLENGYWTSPQILALSPSVTDYRDPFISPSGDRLFFVSKGKIPNSQLPVKENIWFAERTGDGWGEPQPVSEEVNVLQLHWQVSVASNGDLYFTSGPTGFEDIYVSRNVNGQYIKPERLGDSINTDTQFELTPYIAPDESYIIFARLKDSSGQPRLYISYADKGGHWTEAILMERISYGLCPLVSPDGKYLFFLGSPQSVSWMSAEIIEELKPGELK